MARRLRERSSSRYGRLTVLTGARQAGKTTLARHVFPEVTYLSFEDPVVRPTFTRLSAAEWVERYPHAVLDEVQKAPSVVESIRAAYDLSSKVRYLLLGSSQILLLSKVKESLAGRAAIEELWPLTLPEMATSRWEDPVGPSRLIAWLITEKKSNAMLLGVPTTSQSYARFVAIFQRYLHFGGMPVMADPSIGDGERAAWLSDYQRTYLERDVSDLSSLRDLEPFVLSQRAIALQSGRLVNFNDLARLVAIAPPTARRFLRYLELSYQAIVLPAYFRNRQKRLSRMPKVHILDPGVLRSITRRSGEPTGEEFESAVVAEIFKQSRNASVPAEFYHLRTRDGREVDLLIELEAGFVAFEIKEARRVANTDSRSLRNLAELLDKPLLGAFLLSQDPDARILPDGVLALPVAWALSPGD
jgi:predicted AAA+ superfamily ATPase